MKAHSLLILIIAVFVATPLHGDELPTDSQELIRKLDEYAAATRAKAETEIAKKSEQVVQLLNAHLQREAKSGRLQSALAIQAKIKELNAAGAKQEKPEAKVVSTSPNPEWYQNKTWAANNSKVHFTFKEDGTGIKRISNGTELPMNWTLLSNGCIRTSHAGFLEYFWFDSSRRGEKTPTEQRKDGKPIEPQ